MLPKPPRLDLIPSSAERWTTCTASPQFLMDNWDKLPQSDTVFSKEGTTAHEVAAATLEGREPDTKDSYKCPTPVDKAMRWHGWNYAEYVNDLRVDEESVLLIERKLPLWYMPGRNAIVDAAVINSDSMHIVDYKYGAGVVVATEGNLQLVIYAYNIAKTLDAFPADDFPVTLHIYQPRGRASEDAPVHKWETTWGVIKSIGDRIAATAEDIQHGNLFPEFQPVFAPSEKACQWCGAKGFCAARQQSFAKDFEPLAVIDDKPKQLPTAQAMDDAQLAAIVQHGDTITKWVKDVKEYALQRMRAGGTIPGFKLVLSRGGNRYWSDPVRAAKLLIKDSVLRDEEVWEKSVISPSQVEKLIGKNKFPKDVFNLIAKPQGQPVIAPMEDKREACSIEAANEFEVIADYSIEDF